MDFNAIPRTRGPEFDIRDFGMEMADFITIPPPDGARGWRSTSLSELCVNWLYATRDEEIDLHPTWECGNPRTVDGWLEYLDAVLRRRDSQSSRAEIRKLAKEAAELLTDEIRGRFIDSRIPDADICGAVPFRVGEYGRLHFELSPEAIASGRTVQDIYASNTVRIPQILPTFDCRENRDATMLGIIQGHMPVREGLAVFLDFIEILDHAANNLHDTGLPDSIRAFTPSIPTNRWEFGALRKMLANLVENPDVGQKSELIASARRTVDAFVRRQEDMLREESGPSMGA